MNQGRMLSQKNKQKNLNWTLVTQMKRLLHFKDIYFKIKALMLMNSLFAFKQKNHSLHNQKLEDLKKTHPKIIQLLSEEAQKLLR